MKTQTEFTHENLLKHGFKLSKSPFDYYEKILSETIHPDGEDNMVIALVVTHERNINETGLRTPDGIIFLNASLDQLDIISSVILGYSSNF